METLDRTALLIAPMVPRSELVALAPSEVGPVYETGTGGVGRVLDRIRVDATRQQFKTLVLPTLRLPSVSVRRVLKELAVLSELGVKVVSAREPWLDLSSHGALITTLHEMLSEERKANVRAGVARASRKPGRPRVQIDAAKAGVLLDSGMSVRRVAQALGVGASTLQRWRQARALVEGVAA